MAFAESFENIPSALGAGRHWVLRKGKQPVDRYGNPKGWKLPSFWSTLPEVLEVLDKQPGRYDGIGWIMAREPGRGDKQIIGGDFDNCRDPVTGQASAWVMSKLMELLPYAEVSPSECGFRWFAYGKLPDGLDSVTGTGPDDLTDEMRAHILEVKPKAKEKLEKGDNPFNCFEIYEHGRHLTVTGQRLGGFPVNLEDRKASILEFIAPFLKSSKAKDTKAGSRTEGKLTDKESAFKTLARLDIRDVIDCAGFKEEGGQLFGPHPTLGSTTGKNLVVDPKGNRWAYMHNQINSGGGPVEWLAAESGAIRFEDCRPGCLAGNREAAFKTLEHAVNRGLIREEEAFSKSNCKRVEAFRDPHATDRQNIQVNNRFLQDVTADALQALIEANDPPELFVRSGRLARLVSKKCLAIEDLSESALRGMLARAAGFIRVEGPRKDGTPKYMNVNPPLDVVRDILSLGAWPGLPEIEGITETPVIRPDGTILIKPGHDEATGLFYAPPGDLQDIKVPEHPAKEEARGAAQYVLDELLSDFPFKDDASRANALGLLVSVVARPVIDGNVPLALLDKPSAGTGASLLAEVTALIATGRSANMMGAPETEDEWRKAITSCLLDGGSLIVIDNLVRTLRSGSLTRALTSRTWRDRFLGKSEMLDLPQRSIWVATGNNVTIGGDFARRSYWIRMDAGQARPWLRSEFKHPDLLGWAKANHASLLSALLIMARAWHLAGKPKGSVPQMGGFKEWADTVGGILCFADVPGFLGNATELYDSMDQEVIAWDLFLEEWATIHADTPISAGLLRSELTSFEEIYKAFQESMPEDVLEAVNRGKDSMRLAMTLRKHLDQVYPSGRKLSQAWDSHNKQKLWLVDTPAGNHPQNESASVTTDAGMAGICSIPPHGRKNHNSLYRECIGETPAPPAAKATDSDCRAGGIPADPGRISEDLQAGARRAALKEAHDRTPTFKKCDRCGKLLEHGSFQVNDESICLQCFSLEGDI